MVERLEKALGDLASVSEAFSLVTSPEEAMGAALHAARHLLGWPHTGIWMARSPCDWLDLGVVEAQHDMQGLMRLRIGQGLIGRTAQRRAADVVVGGAWTEADQGWAKLGIQAAAAVPAIWHGELVGVLAVWDEDPARQCTPEGLHVLTALGRMFAAAYSSTLLSHAVVGERRRLGDVHGAIRAILEEMDLDIGLRKVAHALRDLGWRQVMVVLCSDEEQISEAVVIGEVSVSPHVGCDTLLPAEIWQQFRNGELESYRSDGVYFVPGEPRDDLHWHDHDVLFAPMRQGTALTGMARMSDPLDGLRPTPEMLWLVDILVSQAAYIVENARLLNQVSHTAARLAEQVDELSMIRRADRELISNLDMDRVVRLALDWAVRRTTASTIVLALVTDDGRGLVPYMTLGPVGEAMSVYNERNPWPSDVGALGRAVQTCEVQRVRLGESEETGRLFPAEARSMLVVPLAMRGEALGVMALASEEDDGFDSSDISFMERLGQRTAVALDNARLYRQMKQMAEDTAALYAASRAISSTLERGEVLERIARTMAETLGCNGAVIYDLRGEKGGWPVLASYPVGEMTGDLYAQPGSPTPDTSAQLMALLRRAADERRPVVLSAADSILQPEDREQLERHQVKTLLLLPLIAQDELIGVAMLTVSRKERRFSASDLAKANALASQASVALRQAMLYNEVLELERIKTEMIRMASHDIRNPLNNVMGYLQLLDRSLQKTGMTTEQKQYMDHLRSSTTMIKSLIEDLLTLERIESERGGVWQVFNFEALVREVVDGSIPGAQLKKQTLTQAEPCAGQLVHGNITQLRQAISNLISNAIKYTPEGGQIHVTCHRDGAQVHFMVRDNGYGIAADRQARMFERFYRARMPGTEHISGSGLGLSLVNTVVERHGGKVWFESEEGRGSTFGFWLPAAPADGAEGRAQNA